MSGSGWVAWPWLTVAPAEFRTDKPEPVGTTRWSNCKVIVAGGWARCWPEVGDEATRVAWAEAGAAATMVVTATSASALRIWRNDRRPRADDRVRPTAQGD